MAPDAVCVLAFYSYTLGGAVDYEWDEAKHHSNLAKHGVDFVKVGAFDWFSAILEEDRRRAYGERRWLALGNIGDRVRGLIDTERGWRRHVISLRKAKQREVDIYEQAFGASDT